MRSPATLALLLAASAALANPPDIYGFGARGIGLAGAMTAAVDDTTANYYNPAALTRRAELQLDTGYLLTNTRLRLNGADVGVDEGTGFQFGVIVPGEIGPVRVAMGLGLFLPENRISRVRALPQQQPRFVYFDNRPQRIVINTNVAIRPLPWLHLGAGITFLTETRGVLDLEGLVFLTDVEKSALQSRVAVDFETIRYPSFGILVEPESRRWSVGATYREQVAVQLDLGARVAGAVVLGEALLDGAFQIDSLNHNLYSPRQLWLGGTFRPIDALLVTMDVGWLGWSTFPPPTAQVTTELEIEALDLDLPSPTAVIEPEFHDIFAIRLGVEGSVRLGGTVVLDFRAGYAYEPSPAPDQPGGTNYVDADKHTIAYGIGVTFHEWSPWVKAPVSIDFGGQTVVLEERKYLKSDPADLVGDYSASGELFSLSGTVRWRF